MQSDTSDILFLNSICSPYAEFSAVLLIDQNGTLPYTKICGFGVVAMLAHLLVFMVAIQDMADTGHMLITIASGLFFVETGAFLLVVTGFRHTITTSRMSL